MRRAFTLIELLVVVAIVALLIGILLPALGSARLQGRAAACGSNLRQLGVALELYQNDFDRMLPQKTFAVAPGYEPVIGTLFGGKKGTLPFYGINSVGPSGRPLNAYIDSRELPLDEQTPHGSESEPSRFQMDAFRSPLDAGFGNTGLPPGFGPTSVESVYDFLGSSYSLNDHAPDEDPQQELVQTLVPPGGGRMPRIADTSRTWVIGTATIFNYDDGGDKQCRWFTKTGERANLLFLDSHVEIGLDVPEGAIDTTEDYTFLPEPGWTGF